MSGMSKNNSYLPSRISGKMCLVRVNSTMVAGEAGIGAPSGLENRRRPATVAWGFDSPSLRSQFGREPLVQVLLLYFK